jgi:hypothetical protein
VTNRDILIERVFRDDGTPLFSSPADGRNEVEELWSVTTAGKDPQTVHPFTAAIDVAIQWADENESLVFIRRTPSAEPKLYEPTA